MSFLSQLSVCLNLGYIFIITSILKQSHKSRAIFFSLLGTIPVLTDRRSKMTSRFWESNSLIMKPTLFSPTTDTENSQFDKKREEFSQYTTKKSLHIHLFIIF